MFIKRIGVFVLSFLLLSTPVMSQRSQQDSLLSLLHKRSADTDKLSVLFALETQTNNPDSSLRYLSQALQLAAQTNNAVARFKTLQRFSNFFRLTADYQQAVDYGLQAVALAESLKDTALLFTAYFELMAIYADLKDTKTMFAYSAKERQLLQSGFFERTDDQRIHLRQYYNSRARAFSLINQMDSSRYYRYLTYAMAQSTGDPMTTGISAVGLGTTYLGSNSDSAFYYYRIADSCFKHSNRNDLLVEIYLGLSKLFANKNGDSAMYYATLAASVSNRSASQKLKLETSLALQQLYAAQNNIDSAYKYLRQANLLKDSLFGPDKLAAVQLLSIRENERIERAAREKLTAQRRAASNLKFLILSVIVVAVCVLAIILVRNNRQKAKANTLLQRKSNELQQTITNLKTTQQQLVHAEKMASLGELTAGIAHEIQNPLNFVNNFSELNLELIAEAKEELQNGSAVDALVITDDIEQNLQKIAQHGRRADAIVKSMLQHSSKTAGAKQSTDINALTNEYLQLSYHGFRAKDSNFQAVLQTHFDPDAGNLNVVSQDIGRVLLNLLNNAFYATAEKKKLMGAAYEPMVEVHTQRTANGIVITVKDNGTGIPQNAIEKIFQPFFTTKPTGEGTGLGLSLGYDIITKGHGGELQVKTKEGEGTQFLIRLPASSSTMLAARDDW